MAEEIPTCTEQNLFILITFNLVANKVYNSIRLRVFDKLYNN